MAYIIDVYNKWDKWDREHSVHRFKINEQWYAIKEVVLNWGKPQLPFRIDSYQNSDTYFIYNTKEEAMEFVQKMRSIN